jgi:hypothetical protein
LLSRLAFNNELAALPREFFPLDPGIVGEGRYELERDLPRESSVPSEALGLGAAGYTAGRCEPGSEEREGEVEYQPGR